MKIAQMNSVYFNGDAISNIAQDINKINQEKNYNSQLVAELFAEDKIKAYPLAIQDYEKGDPIYAFNRFRKLANKIYYLKLYIKATRQYIPNLAKQTIEQADLRIWHYGTFYPLINHFHRNDILYFEGLTDPYLTTGASLMNQSYIYLATVLQGLNPYLWTISKFLKQNLIDIGYPEDRISILPPAPHTKQLPYTKHTSDSSRLLMYGRYAKNKGVPELAKFCFEAGLAFTHFGDNLQQHEYKEEYKKAVRYAYEYNDRERSSNIHILPKQAEIEPFFTNANIFISNSYHEGFAMPPIEAEMHSLPILCRRGTAMDELVTDGYNGYLFDDVREIPDLADRIMKDYHRFSHNAWKHAQGYTYEKYKQRYLKILKEYKKWKAH